jgi:hypothetical protein
MFLSGGRLQLPSALENGRTHYGSFDPISIAKIGNFISEEGRSDKESLP